MTTSVETPRDLIETVADWRLPPKADRLLQQLMDRNTNGSLTAAERDELEALVEWSEAIAPVRARAMQLLGRQPL